MDHQQDLMSMHSGIAGKVESRRDTKSNDGSSMKSYGQAQYRKTFNSDFLKNNVRVKQNPIFINKIPMQGIKQGHKKVHKLVYNQPIHNSN